MSPRRDLPGSRSRITPLLSPGPHREGAVSQAASVRLFLEQRSHVWILVVSNTLCPEPALLSKLSSSLPVREEPRQSQWEDRAG